ncbi:MAG: hypothetical protein IH599_08960, partial [Bacteroidales bacterium]|nr:hypothetical protein [Bacteroidales bacterium]
MKAPALIMMLMSVCLMTAYGQYATLELSFSASNNIQVISMDSIRIMNRTRSCDTMLYWPDSVAILTYSTG